MWLCNFHAHFPDYKFEGSRPEWRISSMIYSRDTPFWSETLKIFSFVAFSCTLETLAAVCIFASRVPGEPLNLLYENEKSVFGAGRGRGLFTCTSLGPRRPLDRDLIFLVLAFQKFHPFHDVITGGRSVREREALKAVACTFTTGKDHLYLFWLLGLTAHKGHKPGICNCSPFSASTWSYLRERDNGSFHFLVPTWVGCGLDGLPVLYKGTRELDAS